MSILLDRSKGIDPVQMFSDIREDEHIFRIDGFQYAFRTTLPFTTVEVAVGKQGRLRPCADKALVLKHKDKAAYVKDLRTLETVRG